MLSGQALLNFATERALPVLAIADLVRSPRATRCLVEQVATSSMPTAFGAFRAVA